MSWHEKESYEKTLEMVREIDPVLILPGCDNGVLPVLRLSKDLGLRSNSLKNYPKMRDKYEMQMALRDYGLAYARSEILNTEKEAEGNRVFDETRDLSSHGGTIYLTGADKRQLEEDLDYITYLEQNHPELLYMIRK